MKKIYSLLVLLLLPLLSGCNRDDSTIKIFISCDQDIDVSRIKEAFSDYKLEISFASPESYYYSFLYKASREKYYDIFIIRDEEYVISDIANIYVPFDENNMNYLKDKPYDFYDVEGVNYGIKLNDYSYKINDYLSFMDGHDYYISLAKMSKKVGDYSLYKTSNIDAFKCFGDLL